MTRKLARCIDFETTGLSPLTSGIVEIGWTDLTFDEVSTDEGMVIKDIEINSNHPASQLVNPGIPIEIGAMAVHHITDEMLEGCPTPSSVLNSLVDGVDYMIAHNAKFEMSFLKDHALLQYPWICTYKAAIRLHPDSPNHQNQTLRYYLKTRVDPLIANVAHRAGPDAYVTAFTYAKFLSMEGAFNANKMMADWTQLPARLPRCPIGAEHRGKPWSEVDSGFLAWIGRQPKMEEDIKYSAAMELQRRRRVNGQS